MRISDWSSDVCSSDLHRFCCSGSDGLIDGRKMGTSRYPCQQCRVSARLELRQDGSGRLPPDHRRAPYGGRPYYEGGLGADAEAELWPDRVRSEEHTSELQSLMRISYAVFCLKKKKKQKNTHEKEHYI